MQRPILLFLQEEDFKCETCGKAAKNRLALLDHIRHHNRIMICDMCDRTFSRKKHLTNHMQTHHMNVKFSCNLCSAEFPSQDKLSTHKRLIHNKKYKCDKCEAVFAHQGTLAEHFSIKHEGKRFNCSYAGCSRQFITLASVTRHLIMVHSVVGENLKKYKAKVTLQ